MTQESKLVSKIFNQQKRTIKNFVQNLTSSATMRRCSNSLKVKQQVAQKLLMPYKLKLDGCKNYGNTSKSVKIDLMII